MRIEELGPPGADHSTGLILHWRGRLLFAIAPVHQWHDGPGGPLARLLGIGGHLEPGETWAEAVCREAREEASLDVSLCAPDSTYLLLEGSTVQDITSRLAWDAPPRPLFVWSARFRFGRPPHEQERYFVNAVFEAKVPDDTEPRPAAEIPAILALEARQLREAAIDAPTLGDLLAEGAMLWTSKELPRRVRLLPGGSAQWYVVLLQYLESARPGWKTDRDRKDEL
jgi:8-oxo-dGTP pyrophosphatase MutT (NUDIX family)